MSTRALTGHLVRHWVRCGKATCTRRHEGYWLLRRTEWDLDRRCWRPVRRYVRLADVERVRAELAQAREQHRTAPRVHAQARRAMRKLDRLWQ